MGNNQNKRQKKMKLFLAAVLASAIAALSIVPTPTAAQEKEWTDAAVAGLSETDKTIYTTRVLVKQQNSLALNSAEQAVADKVTTAAAASKSTWVTENTKTTTAEETAQIEAKAASLLTGDDKTNYDAYAARVAAGTQAQASADELAGKAAFTPRSRPSSPPGVLVPSSLSLTLPLALSSPPLPSSDRDEPTKLS